MRVNSLSEIAEDYEKILQDVVRDAIKESKKKLLRALDEESVRDILVSLEYLGIDNDTAYQLKASGIHRKLLDIRTIFFKAIHKPFNYLSKNSPIPQLTVNRDMLSDIYSFLLEHSQRICNLLENDNS